MKKFNIVSSIAFIFMFTLSFISCSDNDDDDEIIKFEDIELTAGDSQTIKNGENIVWTSENKLIATVDNGTVKAVRVGTVKITSDKGSFTVTVSPKSRLYNEPYMKWGDSKSTVKSHMSNYDLLSETSTVCLYKGNGAADFIGYSFENSRLKSSIAYVPTTYLEALVEFLTERYAYVTSTDDISAMISVDGKTIVAVTAQSISSKVYYAVLYTEAPEGTNLSSRSYEQNTLMLENILKTTWKHKTHKQSMEQLKNLLEQGEKVKE